VILFLILCMALLIILLYMYH